MVLWVLLAVFLVPTLASGATINSVDCSQAQIQIAVNAAATGDIVHLPACVLTNFAGTVTITKTITLEGTGVGTTILRRDAVAATEANPMFRISGVTGFTMRHMQLNGTQDTNPGTYRDLAVEVLSSVDFRIHNTQIDSFAIGVRIQGDALVQRGVLYLNSFTANFCAPTCGGSTALGYAVAVFGNDTYPATMELGTAQNIFVEENTFTTNRHAVITGTGARLVFRHNTIVDNREDAAAIEIQGIVAALGTHGTRQVEIADNTITNSVARLAGILMRGGDGIIYNNSFSANLTDEIRLSHHTTCTGSYPLTDQIRDVYLSGNVLNESGAAGIVVAAGCASYIQEPRDYHLATRPGYVPFGYPHPHRGGLPPDITTGLEMHLAFDENTSTTAEDSTVNNHDGTLGTGVSWGAPKLGVSSIVLDGTGNPNGRVLVTGELTQPTATTLAAWIWPTGFPNVNAEVISIGNHLVLRVSATAVTAFTYTGGAWTTTTASVAIPTTGWTHVAYTTEPGAQRIYVNGSLLAQTSSAAPVSWVGLGANTIIGAHGDGLTFRFQGRIDEARVYTRALPEVDMAALVALTEPEDVALQITTPTTNASYSTASDLLSTLGGTVSAPAGVTGVTWNCPTCIPTFGEAVCTPGCETVPLTATWYVPAITLRQGNNVLTVTGTDGTNPATDSLTVTYTPTPVPGVCTHWASQAGGGNGLAVGSPFMVYQFWALATPGTTLCLKDDTYTGANSMVTPPSGLSGTISLPITIQALNEGGALLDGQNLRNPVVLGATSQWWVIRGLNARNGLTSVFQFLGQNNRGTKLIGWNATSAQSNATIFTVSGAGSVVEDSAGWGTNARVIFQGSGTVSSPGSGYRRVWGEWSDHPTGGTLGGACSQPGKDQFIENLVCTVSKTGD